MRRVLAIDSGTTNTKVFLADGRARLRAGGACETRIAFPGRDRAEQDAGRWFTAACRAAAGAGSRKHVERVAGSFQGGTYVLLDGACRPLAPAVTWLDNRAAAVAATLEHKHGREFFRGKTGHPIGGWAPPAGMLWFRNDAPGLVRRLARISFVADYVNYRLTGRFFLDPSSAAMTMLFNVRRGDWDDDLLELAGLRRSMLPDVIPAYEAGGALTREAARRLGVAAGTPVCAGGHDQYCAHLGADAFRDGRALISCGTAWVFLARTRKPLFRRTGTLAPASHLLKGWYGLMGAASNGGVLYEWMRRTLRLEAAAPAARPSPILVLPRFSAGEGALLNLGLATRPAEILQGTLESMCFQMKGMIEAARGAGRATDLRELVMIGGGARDRVLRQVLADVTGVAVRAGRVSEAAGRGAAVVALTPGGDADGLDRYRLPGVVYRPRSDAREAYGRKYQAYRRLEAAVRAQDQ